MFQEIMDDLMRAHTEDSRLAQFGHPISARQYLKAYHLTSKHVRAGAEVLDWGAGNGHFSYFLVRAGYKTSGCDFEGPPPVCSSFISQGYQFKTCPAEDPISIPFESERFDALTGIGVLEHVRESGGAESRSLVEIRRVLKPGGAFICFHLPNQYSWIEAGLRLTHRWSHRYRYTQEDIVSLAKNTGFDIVEIERYAILPRNIWSWGMQGRTNTGVRLAKTYDSLDEMLSRLIPFFCQNYLFVAKKRGE
jgi:ubiquinone/menaquinone biosynthesis C-methylase UbiE